MDPAFEFAIGWNLVYGNLLSIPSEITAICVLFEFWTDLSPAVWIIVFMILTVLVGVAFVRSEWFIFLIGVAFRHWWEIL